jgi:hypothetical protein
MRIRAGQQRVVPGERIGLVRIVVAAEAAHSYATYDATGGVDQHVEHFFVTGRRKRQEFNRFHCVVDGIDTASVKVDVQLDRASEALHDSDRSGLQHYLARDGVTFTRATALRGEDRAGVAAWR